MTKLLCIIFTSLLLVSNGTKLTSANSMELRDNLSQEMTNRKSGKRLVNPETREVSPLVAEEVKVQQMKNENGTYNLRFVAGINSLDIDNASFNISVEDKNKTYTVTNAYLNVIANSKIYSAEEAFGEGYEYLVAYAITGIPESAVNYTYTCSVDLVENNEVVSTSNLKSITLAQVIKADFDEAGTFTVELYDENTITNTTSNGTAPTFEVINEFFPEDVLEAMPVVDRAGYPKRGGLGLGASGKVGKISLELKEKYRVNRVEINAIKWSSSDGALLVNGLEHTSGGFSTVYSTAGYRDETSVLVWEFDNTISSNVIEISTPGASGKCRSIIYSIKVDFTIDEKHNITVLEAENGTVSVNKTKAYQGHIITLENEPAEGYSFEKYTISYGETTLDLIDNTFVMPNDDVTVNAVFKVNEKYEITTVAAEGYGLSEKLATKGLIYKIDTNAYYSSNSSSSPYYGETFYANTIVGKLNYSKEEALPGENVTVYVDCAEGFELDTLTAKDSNGNELTLTENTFVMPNGNVEVSATFKAKANTLTISFFNETLMGVADNGNTSNKDANVINFVGRQTNEEATANYATFGLGKYGGLGLGTGSKIGTATIKLTNKLTSKVVVNAVRWSATEGNLVVNGVSNENFVSEANLQYFADTRTEAAYNFDNNFEYIFDSSTDEIVLSTGAAACRCLIYSVTIYFE